MLGQMLKSWNLSLSVFFSCILILLIILIKPLTTKAYDRRASGDCGTSGVIMLWLCYCFTPYQRLWLYNGAPLVAFYDTLGIRRKYSRLKPLASSQGVSVRKISTLLYILSNIRLKLSVGLCFYELQISRDFASMFMGVMSILKLRILEIAVFHTNFEI